ncbi:hypothetical protein SDC9_153891 [bioreactor metagenome]|uniref:Uncharacterized protein n=1 Tax=bioreactor metagenome TaxID=1076179 RepID=A0A645EX57_9ZZZZ
MDMVTTVTKAHSMAMRTVKRTFSSVFLVIVITSRFVMFVLIPKNGYGSPYQRQDIPHARG